MPSGLKIDCTGYRFRRDRPPWLITDVYSVRDNPRKARTKKTTAKTMTMANSTQMGRSSQ